jgi:acetate CoA/acetoacetate CoA-transferase alpha subunit
MKKVLSPREAVSHIHDHASIMVGGFMCCGQALRLVDELVKKGSKGLTVVSNDAGFPEKGIGRLIVAGQVKRFIASHMGTNPVAGQRMNAGEMEVELVPQGSLAERIRCGGAGLGGVLTPTGLGTAAEKGKKKIEVNGRKYLLETPLHADFAFIKAAVVDRHGNACVAKAGKNFNIVMAMAAQHCIVEADELVEIGGIDPEHVHIPGVFVDAIAVEKSA